MAPLRNRSKSSSSRPARAGSLGEALKSRLLGPPQRTLAVAESLTCGQVQARIGAISGASGFFLGGLTAYTIAQKVQHLGVDRREAERTRAVSAAVAEQMACGVCRLFGAELGLATTGYAEPDPDAGVPAPFAWWALAHRGARGRFVTVRSGRVECPGEPRVQVQQIVADAVLYQLLEYLKEPGV